MADVASTIEPVSALAGHLEPGVHGLVGEAGPGVRLSERRLGSLWQVAAWPGRLDAVGKTVAKVAGARAAPGPLQSVAGSKGTVLRTEPLKWLIVSDEALAKPEVGTDDGTVLDLSHARTVIRVEGREAEALMARLVPLDLRETVFPEGAVAATGLHHVGVTLTRRDGAIEIWVPRSFGLALWEHVLHSATQFGVETA